MNLLAPAVGPEWEGTTTLFVGDSGCETDPMNARLPYRTARSRRRPADQEPTSTTPIVPMRSCCCAAPPSVSVIMPPTPDRAHTTDLYLCGHHYRAARERLDALDAVVVFLRS